MTIFLYFITVVLIASVYPITMWLMMRGAHRGPHHDPEAPHQLYETVPSSRGPFPGR
jgi:hypothetical protein